jgi:tight adherence protein C
MLLLVLGVAALATAAYFLAEAATLPARQRAVAVRRAASYGRFRFTSRDDGEHFRERVLIPLRNRLAAGVLRLNPRMTVEAVSAKLLAAGMNRRVTATGFLAFKAVTAVSGLVLGALLGGSMAGPGAAMLFGLSLAALGFIAPDFVVSSRARKRRDEVKSQLPDALDLLMISVEAGLGFDGAVGKLTEHMDGALAEEFALTLNEMRIGESRPEALRRLTDRVDTPEVSAFTRAIIQSDQLGMSLGRILRVQAADSRLRRQSAAEEKAMKAPIKMLFPTVLFIFPAMFIVILGPAMLTLGKIFG